MPNGTLLLIDDETLLRQAVETAGGIVVLLLDKTGSITIGSRKAMHFRPATSRTPHGRAAA